jgi:hypothetical protein
VNRGRTIEALLAPPSGHPYRKWRGAHWRLLSATELGIADRRALPLAEQVLGWLVHPDRHVLKPAGLPRRHASQEGNALLACTRIGLADDRRLRDLVELLLGSQWPDGGWNCDERPHAHHSSFHESWAPMLGLAEYGAVTGQRGAREAAERAAEFFLQHRLFRSDSSGKVVHAEFMKLHYPPYWHYDFLRALLGLERLDLLGDQRAAEALELLRSKRRPDGRWKADGRRYWRADTEVVDWSSGLADDILTEAATRVLSALSAPTG